MDTKTRRHTRTSKKEMIVYIWTLQAKNSVLASIRRCWKWSFWTSFSKGFIFRPETLFSCRRKDRLEIQDCCSVNEYLLVVYLYKPIYYYKDISQRSNGTLGNHSPSLRSFRRTLTFSIFPSKAPSSATRQTVKEQTWKCWTSPDARQGTAGPAILMNY